jgi:hypothetical protein
VRARQQAQIHQIVKILLETFLNFPKKNVENHEGMDGMPKAKELFGEDFLGLSHVLYELLQRICLKMSFLNGSKHVHSLRKNKRPVG